MQQHWLTFLVLIPVVRLLSPLLILILVVLVGIVVVMIVVAVHAGWLKYSNITQSKGPKYFSSSNSKTEAKEEK